MVKHLRKGGRSRLKRKAFQWAKDDMLRLGITPESTELICDGFNPDKYGGIKISLYHDESTRETLLRADYRSSASTMYWKIANYDEIRFRHSKLLGKLEKNGQEVFLVISSRFPYPKANLI